MVTAFTRWTSAATIIYTSLRFSITGRLYPTSGYNSYPTTHNTQPEPIPHAYTRTKSLVLTSQSEIVLPPSGCISAQHLTVFEPRQSVPAQTRRSGLYYCSCAAYGIKPLTHSCTPHENQHPALSFSLFLSLSLSPVGVCRYAGS